MPDRVVLDASAALALLRGEPEASVVRAILAATAAADGEILVPDHFWLEVVNVLVRRYRWEADAVVCAIRELDELGVATVAADRPLTLLALDRMTAFGLTAYDAGYLALAEAADGALLTLDAGLAAAAGARARPNTVRRGTRVEEVRAGYGSRGSEIRVPWAHFGSYLAELRSRGAT